MIVPGCTPDFVLPGSRVAVFVDGCFWHGCPTHGTKKFKGPNAGLWEQKIQTNQERDDSNNAAAEAAGWTVLRFWECEVKRDADEVAQRVSQVVRPRS